MSVPVVGSQGEGPAAVRNPDEGDAVIRLDAGRVVLVDDCTCTGSQGLAYVGVPVGLSAAYRYEKRTGTALARVEGDLFDFAGQVAAYGLDFYSLYDTIEQHCHIFP